MIFSRMMTKEHHCFLLFCLMVSFLIAVPSTLPAFDQVPMNQFSPDVNTSVGPDLFTGSLTSSIPIAVPPGRGGMAPALNLTYNSRGENSWLGVGWQLEVGSIERNTRKGVGYYYYDFDNDYVLNLNGVAGELVWIASGEYRLKIEGGFLRIRKLVNGWEVTDKLGTKYLFGRERSSRQDNHVNIDQIFSWCLDEVIDVHGNYMTFTYVKDQGQIYLSQIDYTGHRDQSGQVTLPPTHSVRFFLEDRTDPWTSFAPRWATWANSPPFGVRTAKRLKSIAVYAGNQVHAAYAIYHYPSNSTKRSLPWLIRRYGSDAVVDPANGEITSGTFLPPQFFTYSLDEHTFAGQSNGPNLKVASDPAWAAIDLMRVRYGDFNGDGRTDILHIPAEGGSAPLEFYYSNGAGFGSSVLGPSLAVSSLVDEAKVDLARVNLGDFNGDGRIDLAIVEGLGTSARIKIYYMNPSGSGYSYSFPVDGPLITLGLTPDRRQIDLTRIKLGDFNGDGKTDILIVNGWGSTSAASVYYAAASGSGFDFLRSGPSFPIAGTVADVRVDLARFQIADLKGDGSSDLLYVNAVGQVVVYSAIGVSPNGITGPQLSIRTDPTLAIVDLGRLLLGDFNGDGLADLGYIDGLDAWMPIKIYLSNGSTFSTGPVGPDAYVASSAQGGQIDVARVGVGDFNGDGKTDLYRVDALGSTEMYAFLSTGDGFFLAPDQDVPFYLDPDPPKTLNDLGRIRVGDFNGDGKIDLSRIEGSSGTLTPLRINLAAGPFADLLTAQANGIGGGQLITYQSSASASNPKLPRPLQVVSSVIACDNFNLDVNGIGQCYGQSSSTSYTFSGGYYHSGERDFRGFSVVEVVEPSGLGGRLIHETWFHQGNDVVVNQNNPNVSQGYMKGRPYRTKTRNGSYPLVETTTTYQPDADGQPPYFNPVSQTKSDILDPEGLSSIKQTKTIDYQYDAYGNVTQEEVTGSAGGSENFVTLREFAAINTDAWLIGLPTRETIKASVSAPDKLAETVYCYDGVACSIEMTGQPAPTKGDLTATVRWHSTDADPKTEMGYDSFGNLLWQKDANNNTSRITYDATGTFPIETVNPLGQKTVSQYYGVDGVAADQGLYGQLKNVTYPTMPLSSTYTIGEVQSVNDYWKAVTLSRPHTAPVVITGPPSSFDFSSGVIQVANVAPTSFSLRFREWTYNYNYNWGGHPYIHGNENVPCLVLEKGRTTFPDGTIMEVGTFPLGGTGIFQAQNFTGAFPGRPAVFLTIQTTNDSAPVTVRARNGTNLGFEAALFEEELYMGSSHNTETVGYLAIYNPANAGVITDGGGVDISYQILTKQVNESFSSVNGNFSVALQEEQSRDAEVTHGFETVDILLASKQLFAQSSSFNNADTFTLRHTELNTNGDGQNNLAYYTGTTNLNPAKVTIKYDVFGRKVRESQSRPSGIKMSDSVWTSWSYNSLGVVGSQHVRTDNYTGLWNATYFNGLGKTTQEQKIGADNMVIVRDTTYDGRGQVSQQSLPYYQSENDVNWVNYSYEPLGRVTKITYPDGSKAQACYNRDISVTIDQNGRKRRETRDVHGRLMKVEEYDGFFAECSTSVGIPYAMTRYNFNVLGNLTSVIDITGKINSMAYDTLGRKKSMYNPDMGTWSYLYDANGNLTQQTDAKGQILKFKYDALNRLTMKDYPTGSDTYFLYDEANTHGPAIGRLTTMIDASGTTKYYYADPYGNTVREDRSIGGVTYSVTTYTDPLGRLGSVTYPDGEQVAYSYDTGGNLSQAGGYATLTNYTALGQPRLETLGNGMVSTYDYHPQTKRLTDLRVSNGSQDVLHLSHGYDLGGNPTSITNTLDPSKSQTFQYDGLNRLKQAQSTAYGTLTYSYDKIGNLTTKEGITFTPDSVRPHAVGTSSDGKTYTYDANGNMLADGTRTLTWNYDNLPASISTGAATTFVYDGMGNRVKKVGPAGTTIYVSKLYELSGGVPVKYIYANGQRIALKSPTQTLYYHGNHLGSTSLVTDSARNVVETLFYKPFGGSFSDTGSISVNHKYTGQELDAETGLYYYNARYYNPYIGKFLSADTIVPDPANPQTYNRYSYVQNNPLRYVDPSGHVTIDFDIDGGGSDGGGGYYPDPDYYNNPVPKYGSDDVFDANDGKGKGNPPPGTKPKTTPPPAAKPPAPARQPLPSMSFGNHNWSGTAGADFVQQTTNGTTSIQFPLIYNFIDRPEEPISGADIALNFFPVGSAVKVIRFGKLAVASEEFHRVIKQNILDNAGNYSRVVGNNPDIKIVGEYIWLTGSATGPFKGKTYKTILEAIDFFK